MAIGQAEEHVELVETLDQHVRELVRREGVDPQRDAPLVRRIAEGVVRDHDDLSLTGAVAPVADIDAVVGELVARVSGFGPLQPFLDDPTRRGGLDQRPQPGLHRAQRPARADQPDADHGAGAGAGRADAQVAAAGGSTSASRSWTRCCPRGTGCTWCSRGSAAASRRSTSASSCCGPPGSHDLVELGSLTPRAAAFLEASVRAGLNVLVAGGTQAGKTTMLNCLAAAIPGGERWSVAEEVFELRFPHPDWVPMQTRQSGLEGTGEIKLRHLVKESLRTRVRCRTINNLEACGASGGENPSFCSSSPPPIASAPTSRSNGGGSLRPSQPHDPPPGANRARA